MNQTRTAEIIQHCVVLTDLQAWLINNYQANFILQANPWEIIAQQATFALKTTIESKDIISCIEYLIDKKIITRFGPLYQIENLGGAFTLAAMQVPKSIFDETTKRVNAFAEVAHNYERNHSLNMWFVVATLDQKAQLEVLNKIEVATGLKVYNFPKEYEFFVGMKFNARSGNTVNFINNGLDKTNAIGHINDHAIQQKSVRNNTSDNTNNILPEPILSLIRCTQTGLPVTPRPYSSIAQAIGQTQEWVLQQLATMLANGSIRRIGIVPNHYALGYKYNTMAVFDVDDAHIKPLGEQIGALDFVTHCYQRPRHLPFWQYNLFAMCHAQDKITAQNQVQHILNILKSYCRSHQQLLSLKILKKTGLRI